MVNKELLEEIIWSDIYVDQKTWETITPLDLSGLVGVFSDSEMQDIISMHSNLPENETDAVNLLNEVFRAAVIYLKEELLYEKKVREKN